MFYEEVFRALNRNDVDYLVAGGLALNLHGVPRATQDLDLLLKMTEDNVRTAIEVLRDLGFEAQQPVDPVQFANPETRQRWIEEKNLKGFTLTHPEKPLQSVDLLFGLALDYSDCQADAVVMDSEGLGIPVISVDDLIHLKKQADREVDELDLKMLRKVKGFDDE